MPNNFKAISLKKSKTVEAAKSIQENKIKVAEKANNTSKNMFVEDDKKEEQNNRNPIPVSVQTSQSNDMDDYSFALGKRMKEMAENSKQKFSNIKRQEEESRINREDSINKKIEALRQKMENKMKLEEERKKAKLEHMQKVAEQKLRDIAMRELAEREAICKKEVLAAIEKTAISKGSWFEVAKILYKAGILQ